MKITGSYTVDAPREAFWHALQDPAVLARTLPGCESLQALGDDAYAATVTAGVASIKGTYSGKVQLRDKQVPESYRLRAEGAGAPGTIQADAVVRLEVDGDTTIVHYDADAVVGGMIGGVGQRMIAGAARRTAGEFFSAVANEVLHGPAAVAPAPVAGEPAPAAAAPEVGQVFAGAPAPAGARRSTDLLAAFALGAIAALVGVLVGRRTARRQP
ncbi:SRPBCC family protein [Nitriliruptor alkaliphilus]|uniref:SRPBCC family protein n=1 Tax=Nitriliruptor alkaliphilus TaxID=427918 RepID=UPI000695BBB8|nr:carbon monoxide dehydrogenase subunit G [Nitriliruptor alkaliphilus]